MKGGSGCLKKDNIKLFEGILFVIGFVIGSGIFLKPAIVLDSMGTTSGALMMWIVGGLISLCAALSIAEIAAYIPKVGGLYTYLAELYGDVAGFLYGWVETMIASPGSAAALAIAFATFSTYFIPLDGWEMKVLAVAAIFVISAAQIISTRFGVWIQTLSTLGKLVPIVAIVLFGLLKGSAGDCINMTLIGTGSGSATALLGVLWAYDGWINTCSLGGEMEQSEKNLPIAIITGVVAVIIVYVTFNLAIFAVLPGADIIHSEKIGIDAATKLFGSEAATFITIGMLLSVVGALNGQIITGTRVAYAMGKRKQLPGAEALCTISPRWNTPGVSLVFQTTVAVLYVLSGTFHQITDLIIFVIWIFFTLGILGVFVLRRQMPRKKNLYRVPLYPLVPLLGILGGGYLIYVTIRDSFHSAMLGTGITLLGLIIYFYCKFRYRYHY